MANDLKILIDLVGKDNLSGPFGGAAGALGIVEKAALGVGVAVGAMAAAMVAASAVGVKAAGDLQQSVANLSTIKPEIDTSRIFSQLNELQTRIPQTAEQLGASLYDVFSSIDVFVQGGIDLVEKFGKGATAAMTDAQTFGTAVVGEMNAFGLATDQADHLMDVFFNTVKSGVVTGAELANNLGLISQSAKLAGLDVDTMGALIVGVTKEGGPASQNINNLNNLLLKFNTVDAVKQFDNLGIATQTNDGKIRPFLDVMGDLKVRLERFTQAGQLAAIQAIFPDVQARAGATVILNQLDNVDKALAENRTAVGVAEEAYTKMVGTWNNQSKLLGQTVNSVLTSIGNALLPVLTSVVQGTQAMVAETVPLLDGWQTRLNTAFKTGGFDAWLAELGTVAGELGRQIAVWADQFGAWIEPAKTRVWNGLGELWTGTISPWLEQRRDDLGAKLASEWIPALTAWLQSNEMQTKLNLGLGAVGDHLGTWVTTTGATKFKQAGTDLGNALIDGMQERFLPAHIHEALKNLDMNLDAWLRQRGIGQENGMVPGGGTAGGAPLTGGTGAAPAGASGSSYESYARQAAQRAGIDQDLFIRQLMQESGLQHLDASGRPKRSPAGATGIAQIMPQYHPGVDPTDAFASLDYAAKLMASHLQQYGSYEKALVAYNGGGGAVAALNAGRPYQESQQYLNAILGGRTSPSWAGQSLSLTGQGGGADSQGGRPGLRTGNESFTPPPGSNGRTTRTPTVAGEKAAAEFGQGFMRELQKNEATYAAYFGVAGGRLASALANNLAETVANPSSEGQVASAMEALISDAQKAGLPNWREAGDELAGAILTAITDRTDESKAVALDLIMGMAEAIKHANALTPESFAQALGLVGLDTALGAQGASIMNALGTALEKGGAQNVRALAVSVEQMRVALLSDQALSPADAQAKFESVMGAVQTAIEDGSPAALRELQTFLSDFNRELQSSKIAETARKLADDAIKAAGIQVAAIIAGRDESIKALYTNIAISQFDRSQQQLMDDWTQGYLASTQAYVQGEKEKRAALRETQANERQELQETENLRKGYEEARAALLKKKVGADMSGVMAPTARADPQADANRALRELDAQFAKDQGALATAQAARRQERAERAAERVEDLALFKELDAVNTRAADSAKQINQDWRDNYTLNVTTLREVNKINDAAGLAITKNEEALATALGKIRTDMEIADERVRLLATETIPLVQAAGDLALDGFRQDAEAALQAILQANAAQGGNAPGYTTGPAAGNPEKPPEEPPNELPVFGISANAAGTPDFGGGYTMVGEKGPELAWLPPHSAVWPNGSGPGGGGIDYDRLAAAIVRAEAQHPIVLDGAQLNQNNRTRNNYHAQSNLPNGVGALVSS